MKFGDAFGCMELNQLTAEPPLIPGGFKLGEKVFYSGPSRTWKDQVLCGLMSLLKNMKIQSNTCGSMEPLQELQ